MNVKESPFHRAPRWHALVLLTAWFASLAGCAGSLDNKEDFLPFYESDGGGMVGDAGVLKAEVVLVSKKARDDDRRWVYLDVGKFGGLAETMDEAIRYPIRTPRDGSVAGPCIVAGPTCDSADVLYEKTPYELPLSLTIGDEVLIEWTGAYTTTYSSVAFNGFEPLQAYVI